MHTHAHTRTCVVHAPCRLIELAVGWGEDAAVDAHTHAQASEHKDGPWLIRGHRVPFEAQGLMHL